MRLGRKGLPQQACTDHRLGIGTRLFQCVLFQLVVPGQPQGGVHRLGDLAAPRQFSPVVGMAAQRPLRQLRGFGTGMACQGKVAVLGQRNQALEHVRATLGARQQRMVAQLDGRLVQVAARGLQQVQADEVDHAVPGLFQLGAQKLAAKVAGNLHDALGRVGIHHRQPRRVDDAVLHAMGQGLVEERACVVQLQCGGGGCLHVVINGFLMAQTDARSL